MSIDVSDTLKKAVTGEVILPDSPDYDNSRNIFNRHAKPAVIVRCKTNADIAATIRFARDNNLILSVRSGGHASTGLSTNDGGVVLDMSHFNSVEVIDAGKHLVRIGAGAHWGDAAKKLTDAGLAISSGDTTTVGVGGLITGGGIGWLVRKEALALDHVVAAEIVTAEGQTLHLSETEHPDLFWAIRGGGGNFGVLTSVDIRAVPLKSIVGGLITYDLNDREALLTKWSEYMRSAPEELNSTVVLFPGFGPQVPAQLMLTVCYGGEDEAAARKAIQPLLELGKVQHQDVQTKPYFKMMEDPVAPPGIKSLGRNGFVKHLDNDMISALTTNYGRPQTALIQIRSLGGAMRRVDPNATAFAHRDYEAFVIAVTFAPFDMPQDQANHLNREAFKPLEPYTSGEYINFSSDVSEDRVALAYPPETYKRLAKIKAQYDPDNVFNQNHNIKPQA